MGTQVIMVGTTPWTLQWDGEERVWTITGAHETEIVAPFTVLNDEGNSAMSGEDDDS